MALDLFLEDFKNQQINIATYEGNQKNELMTNYNISIFN